MDTVSGLRNGMGHALTREDAYGGSGLSIAKAALAAASQNLPPEMPLPRSPTLLQLLALRFRERERGEEEAAAGRAGGEDTPVADTCTALSGIAGVVSVACARAA